MFFAKFQRGSPLLFFGLVSHGFLRGFMLFPRIFGVVFLWNFRTQSRAILKDHCGWLKKTKSAYFFRAIKKKRDFFFCFLLCQICALFSSEFWSFLFFSRGFNAPLESADGFQIENAEILMPKRKNAGIPDQIFTGAYSCPQFFQTLLMK